MNRRLAYASAFVLLAPFVLAPAFADAYTVGPWSVIDERDHAIAVLVDPDQAWTLMVRCTDRHLDILIRPIAEPASPQAVIHHYDGTLQVDGGSTIRFPAQTWSQDGYLVLDAAPLLPGIESGLDLAFSFTEGPSRIAMSFLAGHTQAALAPVRRKCEGSVS